MIYHEWLRKWVEEHGSSHLKKGLLAGFDMSDLLEKEYVLKIFPGWYVGSPGKTFDNRPEIEPPEYVLDFFLAEREKVNNCVLYSDSFGYSFAVVVRAGDIMGYKLVPKPNR